MVKNPSTPYRKLAGHVLSWVGPSSIWIAEDHLLYITGYFTEQYRRFYFNDIEALVIQRTNVRLMQALILSVVGVLFLLPFLFIPVEWRILGLIPASLFLVSIIINQILGPGCTCRLVTRINDQNIRCLNREPLALKAVAAFQPALQEMQGELTGREIPVERSAFSPLKLQESKEPGQRAESGVFHVLSCILLLGVAVTSGVCLAYHHAAVASFGMGLFVILLIFVLMSLIRQARSDMRKNVKNWTWAVFIYLMVESMVGYGYFIAASIKNAGDYTSEYEVLRMALQQSPQDSGILMGIYVLTMAGALLLSLMGTLALVNYYSFRTPSRELASPPALDEAGKAETE